MTGQIIAHYRILRLLGKGGMGEVYLAEDTRLKRSVALKLLPESLRQDSERLRRFRIEAEAAAKLNHPHIATIYSIEEAAPAVEAAGRAPHRAVSQPPADDRRHDVGAKNFSPLQTPILFITMEYVDGQPLSAHIPPDGMALGDMGQPRGAAPTGGRAQEAAPAFFDVFLPLADALAHAHERGVTHRDLKPGNIMISTEGIPKILDFGLAQIRIPHSALRTPHALDSQAPTVTAGTPPDSLTTPGLVLGTPAYMSPEQAEGHSLDARTDIFSFGVVMYEALTGQRPFKGESYLSLISSILKDEPAPLTARRPETPYLVERLIRRCLRKDRARRYGTMRDVRNELEEVRQELAAGVALVPADRADRQPGAASTGDLPLRKFRITGGDRRSPDIGPVISPDGRHIAYIQHARLWIRDLDQATPREIPDSDGAQGFPCWSPESDVVVYAAERTIRRVPVYGGLSLTLCDRPPGVIYLTWAGEGTVIATVQSSPGIGNVYEVSVQGGRLRPLVRPDVEGGELFISNHHALPDGRSLIFSVIKADHSYELVVQTGETRRTLVTTDAFLGALCYAPTGHLLYQRSYEGIWAMPFDLSRLEATGDPFLVSLDGRFPSVSRDGTLVYRWESERPDAGLLQLRWVDRSGQPGEPIGPPQEGILSPALSPDGRYVAVSAMHQGRRNIWVYDAARGTRMRLTFDPQTVDHQPAWSPDGAYIVLDADGRRGNPPDLAIVAADGSETAQRLGLEHSLLGVPDWSRDGRYILYHARDLQENYGLWYRACTGDSTPRPLLQPPFDLRCPALSPDGKYVAYQSNESGQTEVYVSRFPEGKGKWQVSVSSGSRPRWNGTGDELFYVEDSTNRLMAVKVDAAPRFQMDLPRPLFSGNDVHAPLAIHFMTYRMYDVTPDGQRFVIVQDAAEEGREKTEPMIMVVQNWYAEFRGR
jgi:serine/threonine-protein kinase